MIRKPKAKKPKVILIIIISVAIGALFVYLLYSSNKLNFLIKNSQTQSSPTDSDPTNTTNSTTSNNQAAPGGESQISSTTPDKPTLIKSSGNYGSVPANIFIEFVCQGTPGLKCKVLLNNQAGSIVELPSQDVEDNGRGQSFTSWEWRSITGTWQVYAVVTNSQGKSAESNKQSLEVK